MTDIHSHILPFVDDGSDSVEKSLQLVKTLAEQGVKRIILTPHFKKSAFETETAKIKEVFNDFCNSVKNLGLGVELYLGQEIFFNDSVYDLFSEGKLLTINDSKYVLLEFDYFQFQDVEDYVYNLKVMGYVPVIAHVERYTYLDVKSMMSLSKMGALLQVNSACILGKYGKKLQKKVFSLIKAGCVDFIASDMHYDRQTSLTESYSVIKKRFGLDVAEKLYKTNAQIFFS